MPYMDKSNRPSRFNVEEWIDGQWVLTVEDIGTGGWLLLLQSKPTNLRAVDRDGNLIIPPMHRTPADSI